MTHGDRGSDNNKGDDVSDTILSFYDDLDNAMHIAEADKTRSQSGNVPSADTTPGSQPCKTEEDAEDDVTKRHRCIYPGLSALNHEGAVRGAGGCIVDPSI